VTVVPSINPALDCSNNLDSNNYHPTRVSSTFVDHTLQLAEVRMLIERAAEMSACAVASWLDQVDLMPTWKTERV